MYFFNKGRYNIFKLNAGNPQINFIKSEYNTNMYYINIVGILENVDSSFHSQKNLDDAMQLLSLCYNYPVLQNYYTSCQQMHECLSMYGIIPPSPNILEQQK